MSELNKNIFTVDETSDLPIWVQLRNRIAHLIRSGEFAPGDQLPSVRSVAASAKINYNTVTKAYRDLELSGMIVSLRGRGMFVQEGAHGEDPEVEAIDALVEDCIKRYRALGLSVEETRERLERASQSALSQKTIVEEARERYRNGI